MGKHVANHTEKHEPKIWTRLPSCTGALRQLALLLSPGSSRLSVAGMPILLRLTGDMSVWQASC